MRIDWTDRIGRRLRPSRVAYAHCDIPCGIYDPHAAEIAAETVEKMVSLISDLGDDDGSVAWRNSFSRYVSVKEQHAELLKREVLIIWSDYFKPPHVEEFPQLHDLFWRAAKSAGDAKKSMDPASGDELLGLIAEITEIFQKTKS